MNESQFFAQVAQVANHYASDDEWVGFQHRPVHSQETWNQQTLMAWELFQKASNNHLQLMLLGDAKIRSDAALLLNFGLVADSPPDEAAQQLAENLMQQRQNIARGAQQPATELVGQGSILSARNWSPLLNDALMLAGILGRQDFLFALDADEQAAWSKLTAQPEKSYSDGAAIQRRLESAASPLPNTAATTLTFAQTLWLEFLHAVPRVLWEHGAPRVFVRELLGLKFFGYQPVFTRHQLGFAHTDGNTRTPTFANYLAGLHAVGLQHADRPAILRALSEFLFQDPSALGTIGE